MADIFAALDQSRYVPLNYPEVAARRAAGCPVPPARCPPVPCYVKDHFCAEWGNNFKCLCPQERLYRSPFRGVREELGSLDYFTRLPDNPNRRFPYPQLHGSLRGRTHAEKYGLGEFKDCPKYEAPWSRLCPESGKVFNFRKDDALCGVCEPPANSETSESLCEEVTDDPYDLPFRVKVGAYPKKEKDLRFQLPKTGVSECLHPSTFHDLTSVHTETYKDFYKTLSLEEIKRYRGKLVRDTRRKPPRLPVDENQGLVMSGPLTVNAVATVMKPKGPQKLPRSDCNVQVIVQGPICI